MRGDCAGTSFNATDKDSDAYNPENWALNDIDCDSDPDYSCTTSVDDESTEEEDENQPLKSDAYYKRRSRTTLFASGDKQAQPNRPFRCSYTGCTAAFSKPVRLEWHLNVHYGERPFICVYPGCDKRYTRPYHLTRHTKSHLPLHTPTASPDDVNSDNIVNLGEARLAARGILAGKPSGKSVVCDVCGETVLSDNLRKHAERRHDKSRFACPDCPRSFLKHRQLQAHTYVHTGVPPFVCVLDGCGKRFVLPSKLKRHVSTHNGYACKEADCGCTFDKFSLLRKHQALHRKQISQHGPGKMCHDTATKEVTFATAGAAVDNTKDVEVFVCQVCHQVFVSARAVRVHWTKIHATVEEKSEVFSCAWASCGKTFSTKGSLTRHTARQHNDKSSV